MQIFDIDPTSQFKDLIVNKIIEISNAELQTDGSCSNSLVREQLKGMKLELTTLFIDQCPPSNCKIVEPEKSKSLKIEDIPSTQI